MDDAPLIEGAGDTPQAKAGAIPAKARDGGDGFHSYGPFTMSKAGLHVEIEKWRDGSKTIEIVFVCPAFKIIGLCRDPHGRAWRRIGAGRRAICSTFLAMAGRAG